jgi:hypothetical protein
MSWTADVAESVTHYVETSEDSDKTEEKIFVPQL